MDNLRPKPILVRIKDNRGEARNISTETIFFEDQKHLLLLDIICLSLVVPDAA